MENCLCSGSTFVVLKSLKSSFVTCSLKWHLPASSSRGLRAMPEESRSALHQGPMGEESPQLSSSLSNPDHPQGDIDLAPDCYSQVCLKPLDGEGERPVSLVSTLSSGSSHDSRTLFGSSVALPSSIPSEEDIDLDLSPADVTVEQAGTHSPVLTASRKRWWQQLDPMVNTKQWNNNNATAGYRAAGEIVHIPTSPVITDTMAPNPKLTYVDRVVMEIIETERMYVKDLRSIVEDYLAHIIDLGSLPIRPEQVCALFGNIEDIYEFNSELLQSLDMCESDPVAVAQCFVNKSEYFEIYTQYCNNYPNSVAALTDCMRCKILAKFFRDRQAVLKRSLPLGSYLLKPVQRILKYHLLLQEIAKHFDPDEEGYEVVQEAISTMTGVAWYINDMKRKHEHAVRVQEIQSLLINWKGPDLTTYGELVLEGTFHVLRAKNTRTLFLFEKMLLITKKRGEHYVYKTHILCSTLMLLDNAKDPLLFSVIHFKRPKQPHTVQAKTVEEKRLWSHHIKRLILENHNAIVPPKVKDVTVDNWIYPAKHQSGPERLMKAESCQAADFHLAGRNERRRSEPAKRTNRNSKDASVMKHAESEGALVRDRSTIMSATSDSTLTSSLGKSQDVKACTERLTTSIDPVEQPSSPDVEPKLCPLPCEGSLEQDCYKEDVLMGDDQDEQTGDAAELKPTAVQAESSPQEENNQHEPVKDALGAQVNSQERHFLNSVEKSNQVEVDCSQFAESPEREADIPEHFNSSMETGEEDERSCSSGLHVEEISARTNGEPSEEEEELLTCSSTSVKNKTFQSPNRCEDLDKQIQKIADTSLKPASEANQLLPGLVSEPSQGEHRSTLSKQDRLLIHKIRNYYEQAEHQDANFSLKRRESLSYIPVGLVSKMSRQLNDVPQEMAVSAQKKSPSRNRPTSWSVFNLPALEKSQNTETCQKTERLSLAEATVRPHAEEDFRPSSEMLKIWEAMEAKEENQEVQQDAAEKVNYGRVTLMQENTTEPPNAKNSKQPSLNLKESEMSAASSLSSMSSSTSSSTAAERRHDLSRSRTFALQTNNNFHPSHLPKYVGFQASVDDDQILQDTVKMKNKVFRLARQYSQRIKNNTPVVCQKNLQPSSQEGLRNMQTVNEEKVKERGKLGFRLQLNTSSQAVIHEVSSSSPVQTPTATSQDTTCSQSPQLEMFLWPHVQELRSKYFEPSQFSRVTCTCRNGKQVGCGTEGCNGSSQKYNSLSDLHKPLSDCNHSKTIHSDECPVLEGSPQHQTDHPLCRWSSVDHVIGSLPLNEVQNFQKLHDEDGHLQEGLNGDMVTSSGKASESTFVKALLEKFQSLSTG
ncbi:pleckstrin homology domain-containing family G member 3 isoform X2 [Oryzias latipes]|uniref:pleckstrin homology domain-containing family G member 3 isoform X2 n=1 Tax=Oryzias latipes TaxID=8090 RepID=UPI0009DA7CB2|nr:pleckstrin homology domain-containing family G member 3 isoform X2 [Oryzias latipes]